MLNLGFANKVTIVSYSNGVEKRLEVKKLSELRNLVINYSGHELPLKRLEGLELEEESTYFIFESNNRIVEVHYGAEKPRKDLKEMYRVEYCRYVENGKTTYIYPHIDKYNTGFPEY